MSSISLNGDTSGSILIQAPAVAGSGTLTLPTGSGTILAGGPAFSAYNNTTQSVTSNTWTKVQLNTERFDTNSCFDTSNYRFTPTVAGYYQINAVLYLSQSGSSNNYAIAIYKNGSEYQAYYLQASASNEGITLSSLISMNGTTDYLELYGFVVGTSPVFVGTTSQNCSLSGFLARAA